MSKPHPRITSTLKVGRSVAGQVLRGARRRRPDRWSGGRPYPPSYDADRAGPGSRTARPARTGG